MLEAVPKVPFIIQCSIKHWVHGNTLCIPIINVPLFIKGKQLESGTETLQADFSLNKINCQYVTARGE